MSTRIEDYAIIGDTRTVVGSVVAFLAGDGASYLTATTIFADGGIMHSSPGL